MDHDRNGKRQSTDLGALGLVGIGIGKMKSPKLFHIPYIIF